MCATDSHAQAFWNMVSTFDFVEIRITKFEHTVLTPLLREDCGIKLNGLIFLKTFESNVDKLED